jgi:hypothetical protein
MHCDDKAFLDGVSGAIEEMSRCVVGETGRRIKDFLGHSLERSKSVEDFKRVMFEEINGSSSCMIAHFVYDVVNFAEIAQSIESGIKSAANAVVERYGEDPRPNGLIYAFRTLAVVNERALTPIDAARKTAEFLIDINTSDAGVRAFAIALKGFCSRF